jgi:crotonobetaine/carnitine-CoA ligase
MSLIGLLQRRHQETPRGAFLHTDGAVWTAAELWQRSEACAAALEDRGIARGDHIALLLENSADFVAAFFGIARIGAVAVTLNTALRSEGLAHVLNHSDARLLIVEQDLVEVALPAASSAERLETIWVRGGAAPTESWEDIIEDNLGRSASLHRRGAGEVAAILYTSGTTGAPKGVMLTDHGYERAAAWFVESMRIRGEDVLHTCLPLFHVNAQQLSLCGALVAGSQLVLDRRFSASRFWASISEHGVTSFNLIGAMLGILHGQTPSPDERRHRVRVACVAPTPAEIHRECEERFGIMLLDGYGLTETTPGNAYNPYGKSREGSCGRPAPYIDIRIADEQGNPLPPRTPGEIVLRAREPNVFMVGYYKDVEATSQAFRDGWFHTGDRGYRDEDGYLYFVDRIKDVIRRRGENISAVEIERAARAHHAVQEAAAVGVPSDLPGGEEDVAVFVIPQPGATVDPEELIAMCEEQLAAFMVPRYVGVLPEFPRTETQRVRKVALRERGVSSCYDRMRSERGRRG